MVVVVDYAEGATANLDIDVFRCKAHSVVIVAVVEKLGDDTETESFWKLCGAPKGLSKAVINTEHGASEEEPNLSKGVFEIGVDGVCMVNISETP